jgi:hypothetical protein
MNIREAALIHRQEFKSPEVKSPAFVVGWRDGSHVIQQGGKTILATSLQTSGAATGQPVDLVGRFFDH